MKSAATALRRHLREEGALGDETTLTRLLASGRFAFWTAEILRGRRAIRWRTRIVPADLCHPLLPDEADEAARWRAWGESVHPRDWQALLCARDAALQDRPAAFRCEYRCRDRDGHWHWIQQEGTFEPVQGRRWRAFGLLTDVTERRLTEDLALGQARILQRIASGAPLTATLDAINLWIEELLPGASASILGYDPETCTLRDLSAPGLPAAYRRILDGFPVRSELGSCGAAIHRREPVVVEDIARSPLWRSIRPIVEPFGLRACWSHPIFDSARQIQGTFAVYHRQVHMPNENERRLLEIAAYLAGVAIERDTAERDLRRSGEVIRRLLASARCVFWSAEVEGRDGDLHWQAMVTNLEAAQRLLPLEARTETEYLSCALAAIDPRDIEAYRSQLSSVLQDRPSSCRREFRVRDRFGQLRWFSEALSAEPLSADRWHLVGVCTDITEQRRTDENLDRALRRVRCLLVTAEVTWDEEREELSYQLHVANPEVAQHLLPLETEESAPYARRFVECRDPAGRIAMRQRLIDALRSGESGYSQEFQVTDRFGRQRWLHEEVSLERVEPGRWRAVSICTDITERRSAERRLQGILTGARCLLWDADVRVKEGEPDFDLRIANLEAAQAMLPLAAQTASEYADGFIGCRHPDDWQSCDRVALAALQKGESGYSQIYRVIDRFRHQHWLREEVSLEPAGPGRWQAVGVCTDITDQKQAQEILDHTLTGVRCLLWSADIEAVGSGFDWRIHVPNFEAARRILPLAADSPETFWTAFYNNTDPVDRLAMDRRAEKALRSGAPSYSQEFRVADESGQVHWLREEVSLEPAGPGRWRAVGVCTEVTERRDAEERIHWQATHDALTRLPNRRLFSQDLQASIERGRREGGQVALLFVDLDRFKQINDSLGHGLGDRVLLHAARCLQRVATGVGQVFRVGGDEFTVLIEASDARAVAARLARSVCRALARPFRIEGHEFALAGSVGIALFPRDGADAETLLRYADIAMYRAKENGGNGVQFFTAPMDHQVINRVQLETDLRRALAREELTLHYQPQIDARLGSVTGLEALVRWRHPERGLLLPAQFIPLAEETGLILPLGEWVLWAACRQAALWQREGMDVRISVNLSARQLAQQSLARSVADCLAEVGLEPGRLSLELTEMALLKQGKAIDNVLGALQAQGIRLQVDDFGTGYSSLASLRRFQMDALKIDRTFVRGLAESAEDTAIVRAVIELGRALGMKVVAEGVESQAQFEALLELGCTAMQGNRFSPPVAAAEVPALLAAVERHLRAALAAGSQVDRV